MRNPDLFSCDMAFKAHLFPEPFDRAGQAAGAGLTRNTSLPLVVGVSTRALFDCEDEHRVFEDEGASAYCSLQHEREGVTLSPGAAFDLVRRLLGVNKNQDRKLVDVVLISRGAPDASLRVFRSCEAHGLPIVAGTFTSGRPTAPYARAWNLDLFLSRNVGDVRDAVALGIAAARVAPPRSSPARTRSDEIHIVLDGDGVTFGVEADAVFRSKGLAAFERHERDNARSPLLPGPFGGELLRKLAILRQSCDGQRKGETSVRLSLVTAREAPAHERVVRTLRHWGIQANEVHFVGHRAKAPFLAAAGATIFFDDRLVNVKNASSVVVAGLVPSD